MSTPTSRRLFGQDSLGRMQPTPCPRLRGLEIRKEVSALRRYETIFILRPDLGESVQKESIRRFENIVRTSGGEVIETDEWGFRELAYNIKGERRGFYIRLDYGGNGATMNEIERNLKLSDNVLRYLSVLLDSDVEPATVRTELEAQRRRSAEARAAAEAARAATEAARAAASEATREKSESPTETKLPSPELQQAESTNAADSAGLNEEGGEET
jgi:small subunit ribosomal protein S6